MLPQATRHLLGAADDEALVSSQLVITTRKISSIEFGKSESQPPVPNPT